MSENMKLWNNLRAVPGLAKKTIQAGRLKGMTDIKPQWRLQLMTEEFGAIGIGWYYEIVRTWTEQAGDEVSAYVEIKLYFKNNEEWSAPVSGIGGSMLLASEKKGMHHSDESYKMATTDALSVAMKQIGVAADVYMGLSDSKYDKKIETTPEKKIDEAQKKTLEAYLKQFVKSGDTKAIGYISDAMADPELSYDNADTIIRHCKAKVG